MSSGSGGNWIGGLVGGIGAGATVRGNNRAADSMNRWYGNMYSPNNINALARGYNPWIWNAISGQKGSTPFSNNLYNIVNGVDTSQWTMNNPLNQINQGGNQNLARFQSLVGRNNSGGGLANMYALANLGGVNNSKANLMSQYGQWREAQNRADANWTLGQVQNSQGQGWNTANALAQSHTFKKNFFQKLGAFGAGYASGEGGTPYTGVQNSQTGSPYQGTQDSFGNIPGPSNSNTGYQDTGQYPYGANNGQWNGTAAGTPNINSSNPYGATGSMSNIQTNPNLWQNNLGINNANNYGY